MCAGLSDADKDQIRRLLNNEHFKGQAQLVDFDPVQHFGMFAALHGDWTPYGRLLLPDLLPVERVLYLDADLVVEVDVLDLKNFDLQHAALAAVASNKLRHSLDNPFLNGRLGITLDADYFNSGVLLMNLVEWRQRQIKQQLLALAQQYPNELISHDQTLLNAVLGNEFLQLPPNYNCPWFAHVQKPSLAGGMILHFLGSPKPWDTMGSYLHSAYSTWIKYLDKEWARRYYKFSFKNLERTWNIRRSYVRVIRKKLSI
jgi:lipopolysaccharide biosynthesis glycosyltransferase